MWARLLLQGRNCQRDPLDGSPYYTSQQIPTNLGTGNGSDFYLVDMADTIVADTLNVMVDASDVAAYYGTDGKVVSTFQETNPSSA